MFAIPLASLFISLLPVAFSAPSLSSTFDSCTGYTNKSPYIGAVPYTIPSGSAAPNVKANTAGLLTAQVSNLPACTAACGSNPACSSATFNSVTSVCTQYANQISLNFDRTASTTTTPASRQLTSLFKRVNNTPTSGLPSDCSICKSDSCYCAGSQVLTGNGNCKLCAGGTFFVGALSGAKAHCVCYNGGDPAKNCGCGTGFTASKLPGIQCSPICPSNQVLSATNTCACQDSLRNSLVDSTQCVPACPASTFATLNSGKDFCAPICQPPSPLPTSVHVYDVCSATALAQTAFSKYAQLQNTGTFSACDLGQECQNFNIEFPTADQAREIEFVLFKRATQSARTAGLPDSCSETCTSASCLCDTGNGFAAVQGKVGCSACVSTPATPMMINSYGYCVPQCTFTPSVYVDANSATRTIMKRQLETLTLPIDLPTLATRQLENVALPIDLPTLPKRQLENVVLPIDLPTLSIRQLENVTLPVGILPSLPIKRQFENITELAELPVELPLF